MSVADTVRARSLALAAALPIALAASMLVAPAAQADLRDILSVRLACSAKEKSLAYAAELGHMRYVVGAGPRGEELDKAKTLACLKARVAKKTNLTELQAYLVRAVVRGDREGFESAASAFDIEAIVKARSDGHLVTKEDEIEKTRRALEIQRVLIAVPETASGENAASAMSNECHEVRSLISTSPAPTFILGKEIMQGMEKKCGQFSRNIAEREEMERRTAQQKARRVAQEKRQAEREARQVAQENRDRAKAKAEDARIESIERATGRRVDQGSSLATGLRRAINGEGFTKPGWMVETNGYGAEAIQNLGEGLGLFIVDIGSDYLTLAVEGLDRAVFSGQRLPSGFYEDAGVYEYVNTQGAPSTVLKIRRVR